MEETRVMGNGFELPLDVLRARQGVKWEKYGADVLPAWVAEMDFTAPYPVRRVLERLIADQEYGYPQRGGRSAEAPLADAFAEHMQSRFGWSPDPGLVQPLSDLVQGTFAAVWAFSDPGDGVVLQLPAYPPFHQAIHETGRRLIAHTLVDEAAGYRLDLDALPGLIDARTRILVLCNPQNPTGRVFSRAELEALGHLAIERDLVIVADEIHADLIHPGAVHIPIASLSPEIAARTVTITSATKGFNIPGLRCGLMHFGSAALRDRFAARLPHRLLGHPSVFGIDATVAAWREGQPWLDEVLPHLTAMRDRAGDFLRRELPMIRMHAPEATYLGWLDCSALGIAGSAYEFFLEHARVAFSPGEAFDPAATRFVRLNFATSQRVLDAILGRVADAVRRTANTRAAA
jgi:cystathionine beta-lyase